MRLGALVALAWLAGGCGLFLDFGADGAGDDDAGAADGASGDARVRDAGRLDAEAGRDASLDAGDSGVLLGSCKEILDAGLSDGDREYTISVGGVAMRVYCDMTSGGWTRVVLISPATGCRATLPLRADEDVCAPPPPPDGCGPEARTDRASFYLDVPLASYARLRGTARGRQYGTTDGFAAGGSIDGKYADGISITFGMPRTHVWTFAAGLFDDASSFDHQTCPCPGSRGTDPPAFVGTSYHCDSANPPGDLACDWEGAALWEDMGTCGPNSDPWFEVDVGPRSDAIEVRVMLDQEDEDIGIELFELYAM